MKIVIPFLLALVATTAAGQSGNVYGHQQAQIAGTAIEAVVVQVATRANEPNWQTRAAGGAIGAALGLLVGSEAERNRAIANTLGAAVGGLIGERASNRLMADEAQEIVLQTAVAGESPRLLVVVQPSPSDRFVAGERVFVVNHAGTVRVVRRWGPTPSPQGTEGRLL